MKTLKLLFVWIYLAIAASCNRTNGSVSGIYVLRFKNEYSIANDTLIIQAYNLAANTYQIERRASFHRIHDGKIMAKEFSRESWMATFNKEKQVLQETELGRQVYIKADGDSLLYEGTYHKFK